VDSDTSTPIAPRTAGVYIKEINKKPEDQKSVFAKQKGTNRFGQKYYKQEYIDNPYVLGPSNELAHSVCLSVCDSTDTKTAFISGLPGTGKSHLIEHLAYVQSKKGWNVYFNNGTGLLDEISQYFTASKMYTINPSGSPKATFVQDFRNMDIIIIDDIQIFDSDKNLSNYLSVFFTIYELASHNKCKMIFTSDKPVSEYSFLEKTAMRLVSRFMEAQSAVISLPDNQMKAEYISRFEKNNSIQFDREAVEYLLRSQTFRVLKGLLQTCLTYKEMNRENLVNSFLKDTFESTSARTSKGSNDVISKIQSILGEHYGVDPNKKKVNTSKKNDNKRERKPNAIARIDNITYYLLQGKISNTILRNILDIQSAHHKHSLERGKAMYEMDKEILQNKIRTVVDI